MKTRHLETGVVQLLFTFCLCLILMGSLWCPKASAEKPEIGTLIDQSNWEKYKEYLGTAAQVLIQKNHLSYRVVARHPHVSMPIEPWTEKCKGKASVSPDDELLNYCGTGVPFPEIDLKDPKAGAKVYWNQDKRYTGDTAIYSPASVVLIDKKGNERGFTAEMLNWKGTERCVLPPVPGTQVRAWIRTNTMAPFDMKGFAALQRIALYELKLPDEQWAYIPSLRRVRRMSTALKGDSFAGSDLTYSDTYPGAPFDFSSKILAFRDMLVCGYCDNACWAEMIEKRQGLNLYNVPVELRPIYILEVKSKDKNYHYSKFVYYIDDEYWMINMKECYDPKGELWKLHTFYGAVSSGVAGAAGVTSMMDIQADHMTFNDTRTYKYNVEIPMEEFSPERLKELGK